MKRWLMVLCTALLGWATLLPAHAGEAAPLALDPVVEARLISIADEVRCLVCQNESLAGSRADLAEDLRREIRGLIKQGKSDAEIMDFLVSRYGDFVRYRPPVKPLTWALWFGPFLLLVLAVWVLVRRVRSGRTAAPEAPMDDAQREAALKMLRQTDTESRT